MKVGTWNVQGIRGKTEEIAKELEKVGIDIAALSETKRKGQGIEQVDQYIHFYSGVPKDQRAKRGISIFIRKKFKQSITDWMTINERILKVNLNHFGYRFTVIGTYGPNEDEDITEKDQYMELLSQTIREIGNNREIILIGDLNARVGRRYNHHIIGSHGEDTENDNGRRLINLCEQYELKVMNGYFAHKDIHKYTWRQESRKLKSIIDHIIVKQKTELKIFDVRACRGPECGSDHHLVRANIGIPYKTQPEHKRATTENSKADNKKYNLERLHDDSTKRLYQQRLDQKLQEEIITQTPQIMYEHIKSAIHDAALEALGEEDKKTKRTNFWWSKELEELKEQKQKQYLKWLQTGDVSDQITYKQDRARFKKKILEQKNMQWEKRCHDLETYIGGRRTTESWKFINSLKKQTNTSLRLNMITKEDWRKYFTQMLNEHREEYKLESEDVRYNLEGDRVQISMEELKAAIRKLKNKRAAGPGGIPSELIKNGTNKLNRIIKILMEKCINGESIPLEWNEGWITPIHKKGAQNICENYRGLTVNCSFYRLYGKILTSLITTDYHIYQTEEQAGFRAGRSTVDNIFCLTQIMEKIMATGRELHMVFVDLTKAYDTVPIKKLFDVLESSPINITLVKAVKNLYKNAFSRVKIGNDLTTQFNVNKGLRQGCSMSPILFNIYLDATLEQWRRKCGGMGIPLEDRTLYTLHYADDQVILARDSEDIEYMFRKLSEEYSKWGLLINLKKTEYLCVGGTGQDIQLENGDTIKACTEFTYLGAKLNNTGRCDEMINNRVNNARKITGALNSILWQKNIRTKTKTLIYDTIVKSTLTYGSEVWQINKAMERKLLATEMDFLRRAARKSRLERVTNEEIRRITKKEETIMEEIQRKQLVWYGHVNRMGDDRLPRMVMNWRPTERRKRGRPRETWLKGITRAMSLRELQEGEWNDRRRWQQGTGRRPHSL